MKLAWVTDVHLDFLDESTIARFCRAVSDTGADGVLVGGDIAQAESVERMLETMRKRIGKRIWFVLGNHDYYGSSIASVRARARNLSSNDSIVWLGGIDVVELTPTVGLVGCDGGGDARLGDHASLGVLLNDFFCIEDLAGAGKDELGRRLNRLGDDEAAHLRRALERALSRFEHVVVLTHVPPFRGACWHQGRISDDEWLPYFTCKAAGDVLLEHARANPDRRLTVLCGHTHSGGTYQPLPNLTVRTGEAEYGSPAVQEPLLEV